MAVGILFSSAPTEARLLNLGGSATLTFSYSRGESEKSLSESRTFGQRYNLGGGGRIFRFGRYQVNGAWFNDKSHSESRSGNRARFESDREITIQEYRIFSTLFTKSSPLALSAQRVIRKNEVGSASSEDRIDLLSANWVMNLRKYPRTTFNYTRSMLDVRSGGRGTGDVQNQAFSVQSEGKIKATYMAMGYQWVESKAEGGSPSRSQALNASLHTTLSSALTMAASARYSTSSVPPSFVVPGTTVFQERSASLSLIYRPPLYWWDARGSYNYSENPFVKDLKSHSLAASANFRPHPKVAGSTSGRLTRVEFERTTLTAEGVAGSVSYRPIFGLTTAAGASLSHSLAKTTDDFTTLSQTYSYSLNYFRTLRRVQANSSYSLGYGQSSTSPGGRTSRSLNNAIHMGASNTDARIVSVSSQVSFLDNRSYSNGSDSQSNTLNASVSANSQYFRNVLRRGDHINLQSSATYGQSWGAGLTGPRETFSASADYTWFRLVAGLAYFIQNLPNETQLDRQSFKGRVGWSLTPLRGMQVRLNTANTYEDSRFRNDTNQFEAGAELSYAIGVVSLGAQYRRVITMFISQDDTTRSTSDSVSGSISRPF